MQEPRRYIRMMKLMMTLSAMMNDQLLLRGLLDSIYGIHGRITYRGQGIDQPSNTLTDCDTGRRFDEERRD